MNLLNFASREAGQRLVDAGIVLETDLYHETRSNILPWIKKTKVELAAI